MGVMNSQLKTTPLDIIQEATGDSSEGVPVGKMYGIVSITICNTCDPDDSDAANRSASFDMHLIPSDKDYTTHSVETTVLKSVELAPGETYLYTSGKIVLNEGEAIVFVASPESPEYVGTDLTDLSATVSYLEV